jgi:hypothetical protein
LSKITERWKWKPNQFFVEVEATTTVANSWQILFDLTTAASFKTTNAYDRVILFPDFGVTGVGTTYYFDDIKQSN